MHTEVPANNQSVASNLLIKPEELDNWFHQKFTEEMQKFQDNINIPSMTIIATKGHHGYGLSGRLILWLQQPPL